MRVPSFDIVGSVDPVSPVVLSVPHAGRDYPLALRAALRVPLDAVVALEDRYADQLVRAARGDETMLVARRARAWIDLNRAETERDPRIDDGARPMAVPFMSAKVRAGLGLVPRRAAPAGDIWKHRLAAEDVAARIVADHRPYHAVLADTLRAARAKFGVAILLDIHSMPPLKDGKGIVIGDRFGRSASSRFVARLEDVARHRGVPVALNTPYPGGHILDRHGAPRRALHAIQIEIDRSRYLDAELRQPGGGFGATAALLRAMIDAVAQEATPQLQAAE